MPSINFIALDGTRQEVSAAVGATILEAAIANDVPMLGTCGGSLVCATCHVKIGAQDRGRLPPPSEDEEDTLDLAFGVTADSRLGCQIRLASEHEGIDIRLAPTVQSL